MNDISTCTILVTRPEQDSLPIKKILESKSYKVLCEAFLEVVFDDVALPDLQNYDGLILTSANAVRAIKGKITYFDLPVFCVGNQTKQEAQAIGLKNIKSTSLTVKGLIEILSKQAGDKRYLYLRGQHISKDLKKILTAVRLEEVTVYHTEKIKQINSSLERDIEKEAIDFVLFYSKRTAEAFVEWVQMHHLEDFLRRTKALCLGDSMVKSVSVLQWKDIIVAMNPHQNGILALIDNSKIVQETESMSKNANEPINNASEIIERFGGIRPMAAKIDTPVTTVQGWKKRDVIPANRRDQIISAAAKNNIDISDLANGAAVANENESKASAANNEQEKSTVQKQPEAKTAEVQKLPQTSVPSVKPEAAAKVQKDNITPFKEQTPQAQTHDKILKALEENNKKAVIMSAWTAAGMILLAGIVGSFLLWPSMKEKNAKIEALQEEVNEVSEKTSFIDNIVPENMQQKMDDLQMQARNIQNTFEQLSDRANDMSSGLVGTDAGPISRRLMVLEEQMSALSGASNFGGLVSRIRSLEDTVQGQEQLKNSVEQLKAMVNKVDQRQENIRDGLAEAQMEASGALGQTLEGVSGNDLKAAAMLIAFSQLRDSLNRQAPFENDLALLEKLVGDDNPELSQSLAQLAPHADSGVLTASGLSNEFKGLAGDVLASSLKGEDISFKEKLKARISNIFRVEKEGELVNGTQTQITVAKAQSLLDEGNIQGAITELKTLDGAAAQEAKPFIEQAEVSLLAERVQQMLGENILSRVKGQLPSESTLSSYPQDVLQSVPQNLDMDEVRRRIQNANPLGSEEVIHDEESGISILPGQQGFRGFSAGQ
ncbi:MAG TPA: uroporphyrinogen-III synthase [Alphaproteobacteria bacterium]|nr:uroporphyrinogen-III synthase [Alphaproteobacteria bacterium]